MSKISHIKYKDVIEAWRFDADFFKPEYLALEKRTESKDFILFENLGLQVDASAFYPSIEPFYNTWNIPFLRVANVDRSIKYDEAVTLPNSVLDEYKTLKLGKPWDLIITKWGSVARIWYVDRECALSRDLIFINTSKLSQQETKFIYFYLLSDFANKLLIKSASLTSQPHLTIWLVKKLPLYFPEKYIRDKIASFFDLSVEKNYKSKQLYQEAEDLLLTELWLKNHTVSHTLTFSTTKKAVDEAWRYDADYFQPKYDELIEKIENYKWGYFSFSDKEYVKIIRWSLIPDKYYNEEEWTPYIRWADFSSWTLWFDKLVYIDKSFNKQNESVIYSWNIVFSLIGSVGSTALVTEEFNNSFISNNVWYLELNGINPESVQIMLQSILWQMQFERLKTQTAQPKISSEQMMEIKLPLINSQLQKEISDKIKESFKLRNESKQLLEQAKKMVEDEIEKA